MIQKMKNDKTFISLFGGIGGFDLPLIKNGWKCEGYYENDKYCCQTYNKNFGTTYVPSDIREVDTNDIKNHTLLCGGFPCQSFSSAGKRKGFEDTRGTLFFEIARIVEDKKPKLLLLENVKGLLNHDGGKTFGIIIQTLDELGYNVEWQVLNSKNFGVPQNRERVFIIGYLRGTSRPEVFPIGESTKESDGKIKRRAIKTSPGSFGSSGTLVDIDDIAPTLTKSMGTGGNNVPIIKIVKDKFQKSVYDTKGISPTLREGHGDVIRINDNKSYILRGRPKYNDGKRSLKMYKYEDTCPTITKTCSSGDQKNIVVEGLNIRKLTPIECERLQGFPDNWTEGVSAGQRYKQLGNAVTVNVVEHIINKLNDNA